MLSIFAGLEEKGILLIDNAEFLEWVEETNNPLHEQSPVPPDDNDLPVEVTDLFLSP